MNKVLSFLKNKWIWVVGIIGGTAVVTNKARNLYWCIIGLILILKMFGQKFLGQKWNNIAMIGLLVYFIYCFIMDFFNKNAIGASSFEGYLTSLYNKIKGLFSSSNSNS